MSMYQDENMLLQAIYDEYQVALRRIAVSLHVPNMELDDVIQETFISYFENYSLTWTPTHMKAMLVKILKRKAIDCLRKYGRYDKVNLDDEASVKNVELLTRFAVTDPLDIIVGDENMMRITTEIANMRQEWKEIAVLYFLEQKTIAEMCEILNITGTVCRSRIYRTRLCLKKILGPEFDI